jgi:hypothetical protein
VHNLSNGEKVFAGQRAEGFFVDPKITDGVTASDNSGPFLNHFPYLGTPNNGFDAK